jgi:hypothetical protein
MSPRIAPFVLVPAVLVAGGFALLRSDPSPAAATPAAAQPPAATATTPVATQLPPNHPPVGGGANPHGGRRAAKPEPPAITWTAPAAWQTAPNPNALRIATYQVPGGAEVSVARAGGTTDANIQRWIAQFDDAGADRREEKTIAGMHVTIVEVAGTYMAGNMMGPRENAHRGWALAGAVVETSKGSSYFFKMLGPADAVRGARPQLDALLASIAPR